MKFTVLNPKGRIWTMVAGGGASVIYADTVSVPACPSVHFSIGTFVELRTLQCFLETILLQVSISTLVYENLLLFEFL